MSFHIGGSPTRSPEVTLVTALSPRSLATVTAPTASQYPVTTEAWATYPAPQDVSPLLGSGSLSIQTGGSGGYPSESEWSTGRNSFSHSPANGFDLPMPDGGIGSHGYNSPYNYPYHGDLEPAQSPFLDSAVIDSSASRPRRHSKHLEPSSSSHARRRYPLSPPPPPAPRPTASSKLRSASRASKNNHLNPPATEEERKNRASHNQVEKQYRNRLNAHFEALLNSLPDYMRGGDDEDDDGDRKISKAEVLEMARRHIVSLERELAVVEGERDELKDNCDRLRWFVTKSEGNTGRAGGGT